ncbi:MarR family winged helix-turn-helix transcriptional regulator [Streptomyces tsukubensis]|uniref:HTH marR-type domain-containing protein n=1 Tax=Streptomyces tsukubensis TaxID=83656 RepID=A0A1V4A7B5_9ACTN|nr:MarR family transcriptional regulator [Streptomyces tsukubensis]OON78045.1 hypothetical protein B1H18_17650 [Streptomyces tsukubensis]QFR97208.1 MarR family transcriptional regulator [Streptomyces tsukubensis]
MDRHRRQEPPDEALSEAAEHLAFSAELITVMAGRTALAVDPSLSPPRLRVLDLLMAQPGVNLTGIARSLGVTLSRASRICAELERIGLVQRTPARGDRREIALELTTEGRRNLETLRERRREWVMGALRSMPAAELSGLLAGIHALAASLATSAADGL